MSEMETTEKPKHESRQTTAYTIGVAIRELENDLAHNGLFPDYKDKSTAKIRIHTSGLSSPSIFITKTQCINWMREHLNNTPTQVSKHWAQEGQFHIQINRSAYWIWVDCGETRFRTEGSQNAMDAADDTRDKLFKELE